MSFNPFNSSIDTQIIHLDEYSQTKHNCVTTTQIKNQNINLARRSYPYAPHLSATNIPTPRVPTTLTSKCTY